MFSNFIKWVDSLFYTTTVTTTTTVTRTYYGESATRHRNEVNGVEVQDNEIRTSLHKEDDYFVVDGREIKIPDVVKNRKPFLNDGKPDYSAYPHYEMAPFKVSYVSDDISFTAYDGVSLSRSGRVNGVSKKNVLSAHAEISDDIRNSFYKTSSETIINGEVLTFHISQTWVCVSFLRKNGSIIQISQENVGHLHNEEECITFAYGYTRAILFALSSVKEDFTSYNEDSLATSIFACFIADNFNE